MDVDAFLARLEQDPTYAGQLVHVRHLPARPACWAQPEQLDPPAVAALLPRLGLDQLYSHQAQAVRLALAGDDLLVATGTASGKTLCYVLPILTALQTDPAGTALLLFPTKALCQDQFRRISGLLERAGLTDRMAGVLDGDTPAGVRRRLRDQAGLVFSNPDMLHAGVMPRHDRWARFLGDLRYLVLDELHAYHGILGSNLALVLRRFWRLCRHYGSTPRLIACSATVANPAEFGRRLTGRELTVIDEDGSPRGRRTYVFWNPPRIRDTRYRSRRSANVEAHELMARLIEQGTPTITFSKARMTAELIHRYVRETLARTAPHLCDRVTPYRGGYLAEERRAIEERLFRGELLGVSTTPALELGIDVGTLDACIIVGYPGRRSSFFQQAGRAGRQREGSVTFLVGLDTAVNQYVMNRPDYLFEVAIEQAVIDPENPFVVLEYLRCATHELPLEADEVPGFGPHAELALQVLAGNGKVRRLGPRWYHAAAEVPHYEVLLRGYGGDTVVIQDVDSGEVVGELSEYNAEPILHPGAIYLHRGDTYRVLELDLSRRLALIRREEVDYYTQPLGGTDVHHVDHRLRDKPFGTGRACWGEVTSHFHTSAYERIDFYSLDAVSQHGLDLPVLTLETTAFWLVPPEWVMDRVRQAGLEVHLGLRGVGYATRMLLPLFLTCETLDFSHSVGCANAPWNAVFVYERHLHGVGFTLKAYERLHEIMPAVRDRVAACPCEDGCPCCVGKPLRQTAAWSVERGEASIPSKVATLMILDGLLGDGSRLRGTEAVMPGTAADRLRLEQALRRRLERQREPAVFHPIIPASAMTTAYPAVEPERELAKPDVTRRLGRRLGVDRDLHRRIATRTRQVGPRVDRVEDRPIGPEDAMPPDLANKGESQVPDDLIETVPTEPLSSTVRMGEASSPPAPPAPTKAGPTPSSEQPPDSSSPTGPAGRVVFLGDRLAARARRRRDEPSDLKPDADGPTASSPSAEPGNP
ncbi:MAG: DEAD/DEAH box helicase [Candidatus Latescibacterota bacterium]